MLIKIVTPETAERERQQEEIAFQDAFRQGYGQACLEIVNSLLPVSNRITEAAVKNLEMLGETAFGLSTHSAKFIGDRLDRSLQRFLQITQDYLVLKANEARHKAERERLQQEVALAKQDARQAQHYKEQLTRANTRISTVEADNATLRQDIERLEGEIDRQHQLIVELNERLKPRRPEPQKQKSG